MQSPRFKLNRTDLVKLLRSLGLSLMGASLVVLGDAVTQVDWDSATWGPVVGAMAPFVLNTLRRLLKGSV